MRTTARTAPFMPGESPPEESTPILVTFLTLIKFDSLCLENFQDGVAIIKNVQLIFYEAPKVMI